MAGKKRETLDLSGKSVVVIKKIILTIFNWDFVCSLSVFLFRQRPQITFPLH